MLLQLLLKAWPLITGRNNKIVATVFKTRLWVLITVSCLLQKICPDMVRIESIETYDMYKHARSRS